MGTLDELRSTFGEDFLDRKTERSTGHNWHELCPCGHLDRFHSPSIGGIYRLPEPHTATARGVTWHVFTVFDGCVGALRPRGFEEMTQTADHEAHRRTDLIHPTCPCEDFRPVAKVDRPNRYFNQRMPIDRSDPARHPFIVGLRAFTTHLTRRRRAIDDPSWAMAELDRRFRWLDGQRRCHECEATEEVWPVFINGDRSELRCPKHR